MNFNFGAPLIAFCQCRYRTSNVRLFYVKFHNCPHLELLPKLDRTSTQVEVSDEEQPHGEGRVRGIPGETGYKGLVRNNTRIISNGNNRKKNDRRRNLPCRVIK